MKLADITNFKNRTARKIREGNLSEALADMRAFSEGNMNWELTTAIDSLSQNYNYMLRYVASGADDPGQADVYDGMVADALLLVDRLTRQAFTLENPTLYYSSLRSQSVRPGESVTSLANSYVAELRRLDDDFDSISDPKRTLKAETLLSQLFTRIWTAYPLSAEDLGTIEAMFDPSSSLYVPTHARALIVSAVTLGLLEFYDTRRFVFLFSTYIGSDSATVRLRALVGALAAMFRYRQRPVPKDVANAFAAAREHDSWADDFTAAAVEFMRASETDKISEKMEKEVFPSLMKVDPEIRQKLQSGDFDLESLSEGFNPEWEEKLSNSDVARGLKEITEIQADGGDVFMGSFSHMKQYPFFNDIANWFLPFYESHSAVVSVDTLDGSLGTLLSKMPILCDSDKFSTILSFDHIPDAQRQNLITALGAQSEQMRAALNEVQKASDLQQRRNIINKYIQNLYRFFKLFRRRNEFFPLFDHTPALLEVKPLQAAFDDETRLSTIGEFYFRHKFWPQAAHIFGMIDKIAVPDARRAQQLGFALECSGRNEEAISHYEEAELLDGGSMWTLRHLAGALRREGKPERAAQYYKRLAEQLPDDPNVALNLGYTLSEAGKNAEAEAQFHKAAYLMPDSLRPLRGLAWTQFLNRKFEQSAATYQRIVSQGPTPDDYLNAGHLALAQGNVREAVNYYRLYDSTSGTDLEKALKADAHFLTQAGVDTSRLKLLIEAIKYTD